MTSRIYKCQGALLNARGECQFRVWAPFRENVTLLLPGSRENTYPMQRDEEGYWEVLVAGIRPGALYYYLLDGTLQRPDPASRNQPEGVHGPSAVTDPAAFTFTDDHWTGMRLEEMIIYELHTGAFTPEGTLQGIISRLPALLELGITAIEIMPLAQCPGRRNWGYDGVYPFALHNAYGSADDLKELVNTAHALGLAVILDVVYNHQGPEGNYLQDYGPYFTDRYCTPWGQAINFDGAWSDAVRAFYIQNALMWLDEFHMDGLRLDAVHAYWDSSALHVVQELAEAVQQLEARTGKKKVLIGETDLNNPRYINPVEKGGYGLHGQWADEFHHALHSRLTGERNGYYEDFGCLSQLAAAFEHAYVYTGQYSPHRKRRFGALPEHNPYSQFVVFAQNHDQVGNRMLGERLGALLPFEALKLAAATVLLSPFVPLLFMGEEYGERRPFLFFTSHGDPQLISALQAGRKREFAAFHAGGEAPDPQSLQTFQASVLSWDMQSPDNAALLACYRFLIDFRKNRPALRNDRREGTRVHAVLNDALLVLEREDEHSQDRLLILFNFDRQEQVWHSAGMQPVRKLFDSAEEAWNGPGTTAADRPEEGFIRVSPLSAVIYETTALKLFANET
ncbi:malto-oligosyltrehalose trehalohydrolase [Chitinophaga japonensis]|uniref:Malto-oligosyltrehalose trehalohydrolase n=1 Tax=Chitinophaga japonensis TaxID=104662 RepID=A0A562T5E4_CHIJA|nr:malto-oligosyltrehalose trehalohydrolase [Chitinophaga japonensis]TWI88761.1 maltooligosyl trehalose hydrolase [Chitinophaga japonensis]